MDQGSSGMPEGEAWSVSAAAVPFAFRYDGRPSGEVLAAWRRVPEGDDAYGWQDPHTGLYVGVRVRRFADSPAVDWVLEFENRGGGETPVIEEVLPLDLRLPVRAAEVVRVHYARGSAARLDDFLPCCDELNPYFDDPIALGSRRGRSSDAVLPYFHLDREGDGLTVAVGWSGQWAVRLERGRTHEPGAAKGPDAARLRAGMARTHFRLRPGERVRTPRILAMPWRGGTREEAANRFRRLLLRHYVPRADGAPVRLPLAFCLFGVLDVTGRMDADLERRAQGRAAQVGLDGHWVDASWFGRPGHPWWEETGSWTVNRERYPDGLRPIADAAHAAGMRFILWCDAEHVRAGSRLANEHPEFLLRRTDRDVDNLLLDLGNPDARAYITDLVSRLISEHGVDVYRQDFNVCPIQYWREADAPDRVGMAEMRHIEGLYAFWDDLRRRHPGLLIDNCASGGTRLDLETCARSVPLWATDFQCSVFHAFGLEALATSAQCISGGLAPWVPLFGSGVSTFDPYGFRSLVAAGRVCCYHIERPEAGPSAPTGRHDWRQVFRSGRSLADEDFPVALARQALAEAAGLRPYFEGDFYALLPVTVSPTDWCAYQYHRPDLDAGFAVFFRRPESPFPAMEVALRGLGADGRYEISLSPGYEEGSRRDVSAQDLRALAVSIPNRPGSVLLRYRPVHAVP
jgi:alpha-galactosidase